MSTKRVVKNTDDVLTIMCESIQRILRLTTNSMISFSPVIQRISNTCLKPDIGCFVLFDGGFCGLVVLNFSSEASMDIYRKYMLSMGMPEDELAHRHTSDEVGDSLAELVNQIVGDFQVNLEKQLQISVNQSQPKVLAINNELLISINTRIDRPVTRRVAFETETHRRFYLEMAVEKIEFVSMTGFQEQESTDPDTIMQQHGHQHTDVTAKSSEVVDDDFMSQLGL